MDCNGYLGSSQARQLQLNIDRTTPQTVLARDLLQTSVGPGGKAQPHTK